VETQTLHSILESEKSSTTLLLPHLLPIFFFFSYSSIWPELDQSFFKATNLQTCFLVKNFLRLGGELMVNLCFSHLYSLIVLLSIVNMVSEPGSHISSSWRWCAWGLNFSFPESFPLWFGSSHFFFNITTPESSSSSSHLLSGKFVMETHDADFCIPKNWFAKNSEQMLLWLYTYL